MESGNQQESNDPLLIFMHVQKTGGTTLLDIIADQYHHGELVLWGFHRLRKKRRDTRYKCVHHAHAPFGLHHYYEKRPFVYFTMLRNPVDRVLSQYYYIRQHNIHPLHNRVKQMSLGQFLNDRHHVCQRLTRNLQTQMACGQWDPARANLKTAKNNLTKHFTVVGITEMFNESLFLMKKALGWEKFSYSKQNVTKKRPARDEIPKHLIGKIEKMNQLDIALYNWAEARMKKRLQEMDPETKAEMNKFIGRLHSE